MKLTNLRERRQALGLTQSDLAIKIGVSLVSIQLWERGVTTPKESNLRALETYLENAEAALSQTQQVA